MSAKAKVFYSLSLQEVSWLHFILCAKLSKKHLQFQDFDNAFSLIQKEEIVNDAYFKNIILNLKVCDVVILNGEGGIYDLQPKGVMTLFIAYIAKVKFDKIVALVNHTTDISHPIMKEIVANVYPVLDNIVYRENISFSTVSKEIQLKNSYLGADAAFNIVNSKDFFKIKDYNPENYRGIYPEEGFSMPSKKPIVCISGSSILFRKDRPKPQYPVISGISELVSLLRSKNIEVIFLAADASDYKLLKPVSVYSKVPIISASTPTFDNLGLLSNVDCVISGRWHLSILSCCVGTPIILGDANTLKTKALHEIFGLNIPMFSYLDLKSYLKTMSDSVEKVVEEARVIRPKIESLACANAKKALLNVKILEL
jgi:polysaccharide pyruvyl transferase WcaK-like protein